MTEVNQQYLLRSKEREFTDRIYESFHAAEFDFDLTGLWIGVTQVEHKLESAPGSTMRKAARELVDLVRSSIDSLDVLRPLLCRRVRVDVSAYPSLGQLASHVDLGLGPDADPRRSDGKAAPVAIVSGGRVIDKEAEVRWYADRLRKKSQDRLRLTPPTNWGMVDHSILLFHDHPGRTIYNGFGDFTERFLRAAVDLCVTESASFNEILLLTYRKLEFELIQISGVRASLPASDT